LYHGGLEVTNLLKKIGILLIVLSFVFYGLILLIPLLSVTLKTKTILTTSLVVVGEISFWSGGLILGKEMVNKYRSLFNPKNWFKRKL
jgi:hypothetical protein